MGVRYEALDQLAGLLVVELHEGFPARIILENHLELMGSVERLEKGVALIVLLHSCSPSDIPRQIGAPVPGGESAGSSKRMEEHLHTIEDVLSDEVIHTMNRWA